MTKPRARVFYQSHATEDIYSLVRDVAGSDYDLVFLQSDDDDARLRLIADCDAVICAATPLRKRHLDAAKKLRVVLHQGVGWQDTTDWQAIKARGLPLALTPEGTTIGVAEHTVLLMLAAAKHLTFADAELRRGAWHVNSLRARSRELFGKTIGYIGMGRIAQAVAERLAAFGCAGIYYDPVVSLSSETESKLGLRGAGFEDVLAAADVLTIHVPRTPETSHLIDAGALLKLKPGAIVVNTARGGILDEQALADALRSGRVLSAGIDVFDQEPPAQDNPLIGLSNVVLTPHISAGTEDAMRQKMAAVFANLDRFLKGEALCNQVVFP